MIEVLNQLKSVQPTERGEMKAYIKPHKDDALWLIVERKFKPIDEASVEFLKEVFGSEDEDENIAYAIMKDEVEAIKDACEEYLESLAVAQR